MIVDRCLRDDPGRVSKRAPPSRSISWPGRLVTALAFLLVTYGGAQGQIRVAESKSDDAELSLDLYGFLFGQLVIDGNQTGRDPFLNIQPLPGSPGVPDDSPDAFFSVAATRIGLALRYRWGGVGVLGRLETDFDTPSGAPRIRHAYAELNTGSWRVLGGQTWSILSQLNPTTIDSDNLFNIGNTYERVPQVRVAFGRAGEWGTLELEVGAATFFGEFDQGALAVQIDSAAPEVLEIAPNTPPVLQARLLFGWGKGTRSGLVAVGGSVGRVDMLGESGAEGDAPHALVVGELLLPLPGPVELMIEVFFGRAPGFNGGIGQTVVVTATGAVVPVESWGGFAQLALRAGEKLNVNVVGGLDNPKNRPGGTPLILGRNVTLLGNVFWTVVEHFTAAFELQHIQSNYEKAAASAENTRATFAVYLTF